MHYIGMILARVLVVIGILALLWAAAAGLLAPFPQYAPLALLALGLVVISSTRFICAKLEELSQQTNRVIEDASITPPHGSDPVTSSQRKVNLPSIPTRRRSARRADEEFDAWVKRVAAEDDADIQQRSKP